MVKYVLKNENIYQKSILLNLKLVILFTPLILNKYVDYFRANQQAWLKLLVLFGIGLYALKYLNKKEFTWKKNQLNLPIFIFILTMSFSLLKSYSLSISICDYLIFLAYFFLYFLIINNVINENHFYAFIRLFFITSFLIALYTILHYYGFIPYLKEYGPVISTIGQKNWISNYLALIFPLIFCYFLLEEIRKNKNIYYLLLSIIYAALMICQSRGIWISIVITILIGIPFVYKFKLFKIFQDNQKWLIILFITFSIITLIYSTDNPLNRSPITVTQRALSTFDQKDPSINTRILIWKNTLEMIKNNPWLGSGIGSFKLNYLNYQAGFLRNNPDYLKYWAHAGEAHNEYLQMAAELGIVGLGIFLSILFIFYSLIMKYLKEANDNRNKIIIFGLFMGITCFLIHSLFTFPLHVPALGSAFFIIVGLTVVYLRDFRFPEFNKHKNENKTVIKRQSSKLTILFTILILLIMIFIVDSIVIKPYLAEVYAYKGRENLALVSYNNALSNFEYAAKLNPYNGRILLNLGATYYNLGFFENAENTLKQSKKYYNDRNIYRNLGLCYMQLERVQEAEEEFKHAIYLDPKFTKAYFDLGLLYFQQEDYDGAIEQWEKILEIDPDFSDKYIILTDLGMVYKKKKMPDKALEYFLRALQLAPDDSPIIDDIEKEIYNIYRSHLDN